MATPFDDLVMLDDPPVLGFDPTGHSGIFRQDLQLQPGDRLDEAFRIMEAAVPVQYEAPPQKTDDYFKREQRVLLALTTDAGKRSIFGNTEAWGYHELYTPLTPARPEEEVQALVAAEHERCPWLHHSLLAPMAAAFRSDDAARALIQAERARLNAIAEAEVEHAPIGGGTDAMRHFFEGAGHKAFRYMVDNGLRDDVIVEDDGALTVDPRGRGAQAYPPREVFEGAPQGIFEARGADIGLSAEPAIDPSHPEWARVVAETRRDTILSLLKPEERGDRAALRTLVSRYLAAERDRFDDDAAIGSGVFDGMAPSQRADVQIDLPIAEHKPSESWWAYSAFYLGIEQADLDAALSAVEAVQGDDPLDVAMEIVAGDYLERAVDHLLAKLPETPWVEPNRDADAALLRELFRAVVEVDTDPWTLRGMLGLMANDGELWALLARAKEQLL